MLTAVLSAHCPTNISLGVISCSCTHSPPFVLLSHLLLATWYPKLISLYYTASAPAFATIVADKKHTPSNSIPSTWAPDQCFIFQFNPPPFPPHSLLFIPPPIFCATPFVACVSQPFVHPAPGALSPLPLPPCTHLPKREWGGLSPSPSPLAPPGPRAQRPAKTSKPQRKRDQKSRRMRFEALTPPLPAVLAAATSGYPPALSKTTHQPVFPLPLREGMRPAPAHKTKSLLRARMRGGRGR